MNDIAASSRPLATGYSIPATWTGRPQSPSATRNITLQITPARAPNEFDLLTFSGLPAGQKSYPLDPILLAHLCGADNPKPGPTKFVVSASGIGPSVAVDTKDIIAVLKRERPLDLETAQYVSKTVNREKFPDVISFNQEFERCYVTRKLDTLLLNRPHGAALKIPVTRGELRDALGLMTPGARPPETATHRLLASPLAATIAQDEWKGTTPTGTVKRGRDGLAYLLESFGTRSSYRNISFDKPKLRAAIINEAALTPRTSLLCLLDQALRACRPREAFMQRSVAAARNTQGLSR